MKICTRCNQTKQLTDFSRGKSMCKPCATMDIQERNKTPNNEIIEYSDLLIHFPL